jgi:hypothetical protein
MLVRVGFAAGQVEDLGSQPFADEQQPPALENRRGDDADMLSCHYRRWWHMERPED